MTKRKPQKRVSISFTERGDKDGDWRWGDKAKGFLIAE